MTLQQQLDNARAQRDAVLKEAKHFRDAANYDRAEGLELKAQKWNEHIARIEHLLAEELKESAANSEARAAHGIKKYDEDGNYTDEWLEMISKRPAAKAATSPSSVVRLGPAHRASVETVRPSVSSARQSGVMTKDVPVSAERHAYLPEFYEARNAWHDAGRPKSGTEFVRMTRAMDALAAK